MAVLIPKKLIYLEHPRTGSTSVRLVLSKIHGARTKSRHTLFLPERGEKVLSVVRNPYDALVSWWLVVKDKWKFPDFKTFLKDCNNKFFVQRGNLFYFAKHSDFIIKFENLESELNKVLEAVGLRPVVLPRANVTKDKKPFVDYYDQEAEEIVKTRFESELKAFNYDLGRPGSPEAAGLSKKLRRE